MCSHNYIGGISFYYIVFQAREDVTTNDFIGTVFATDVDMPALITYLSDSSEFAVQPITGEIFRRSTAVLDFESR